VQRAAVVGDHEHGALEQHDELDERRAAGEVEAAAARVGRDLVEHAAHDGGLRGRADEDEALDRRDLGLEALDEARVALARPAALVAEVGGVHVDDDERALPRHAQRLEPRPRRRALVDPHAGREQARGRAGLDAQRVEQGEHRASVGQRRVEVHRVGEQRAAPARAHEEAHAAARATGPREQVAQARVELEVERQVVARGAQAQHERGHAGQQRPQPAARHDADLVDAFQAPHELGIGLEGQEGDPRAGVGRLELPQQRRGEQHRAHAQELHDEDAAHPPRVGRRRRRAAQQQPQREREQEGQRAERQPDEQVEPDERAGLHGPARSVRAVRPGIPYCWSGACPARKFRA
jgi:hypothetical protein